MKILAATQGASLQIMLGLSEAIHKQIPHELSLIVSDSAEYIDMLHNDDHSERLDKSDVLKEWELFDASRSHDSSEKETTYWEELIKEPLMWTLFADRHLAQGKYNKVTQKYSPRLPDDRMIQIISYGYKAIDEFFYLQSPDLVLSFGITTYCDYIAKKIAEKHEVPFYIINSGKIGSNINLIKNPAEWPFSVWTDFKKTSHLLDCDSIPLECVNRAQNYVQKIQENGFSCEYGETATSAQKFEWIKAFKSVAIGAAQALQKGRDPIISGDHYIDGYFRTAVYREVIHPWRSWRVSEYLRERYIDPENLPGGHRRIFYPLYFEPESCLYTHGLRFQNQIETIRMLAGSSPADCEILVKEHPKSNGFRPLSYYKKLLQIPGVRLVPPNMPSNQAIALCNAAAVVAGAIGLEAAILGKPVLILGRPPYRHLGKPHFHVNKNPWKLHRTIEAILDPTTSDAIRRAGEEVFIRLLSIVLEDSCPADLNALFIEKSGRQIADMFGEKMTRRQQLEGLIVYLKSKFTEIEEKKVEEKVA
ncbi:MAG: hypothetical protein ACRBBN_15015 [Methyloligellaceae bacterium]